MAKFKFRLESFLNIKSKLEDQKKTEYGKVMTQLQEEINHKKELEDKLIKYTDEFKKSSRQSINPLLFRNFNNCIDCTKQDIINQDEIISKMQILVEEKRSELVEAIKERKSLEILKEKYMEEYFKEELLKEQKIIDEIVSYQYNNKS